MTVADVAVSWVRLYWNSYFKKINKITLTFLELLTSFEWPSYFHSNMHYTCQKSFLFAVSHTVTYAAYKYTRSTFNWKFNLQRIRFVSFHRNRILCYNYNILTEQYGHSTIIFNEYPHERKPISRGNSILFRFSKLVSLFFLFVPILS